MSMVHVAALSPHDASRRLRRAGGVVKKNLVAEFSCRETEVIDLTDQIRDVFAACDLQGALDSARSGALPSDRAPPPTPPGVVGGERRRGPGALEP